VHTADGQVGAWRVSNHQVPPVIDDVKHIALVVRAWRVSRQQIT